MRRLGTHPRREQSRGRNDDQLTSTDISTQVEETARGHRETGWQRRARENETSQAQAMNLLEQIAASAGGILSLAQAAPENDVLLQGTYLVGANGWWTNSWKQSFSAVLVANLSTKELVVTSSAPTEAVPSVGAGIFRLPSGLWRLVPMRGSALTIYGTPTSRFDVAVYVRPQPPSGGQCGTG